MMETFLLDLSKNQVARPQGVTSIVLDEAIINMVWLKRKTSRDMPIVRLKTKHNVSLILPTPNILKALV